MESKEAKSILKEGFLDKMGGSVHSIKRRYFIVYPGSLEYFKDQSQKEKLGTIPLLDSSVGIESGEENVFSFVVRLPSSAQSVKRNEYIIQAPTKEERASWIFSINACTIHTVFKRNLIEATKVNPINLGINLPVPYFIVKAVNYLEDNGALEMEGLYRLNGAATKIDQIVETINSNADFEFDDIHVATGIIKLYMRTIPKSIILPENCDKLKLINTSSPEKQIELIRTILRTLPIPNYCLLAYLFKHLKRLNANVEKNKMDERAISVCIGPSLIYSEVGGKTIDALTESSIQQSASTKLLENYEDVFGLNPLMFYNSTGSTSFKKLNQDLSSFSSPFLLKAPKDAIVQKIAEDKDGWTICVYDNVWGCVQSTFLDDASSDEILKDVLNQKHKWELSPEEIKVFNEKYPEAAELYKSLKEKLDSQRGSA